MLPDFAVSEVSRPLYGNREQPESRPEQEESVRLEAEYPRSEIPDEALRTEIKGDDRRVQAPEWREVEDKVMEEPMSEDDREWRTREWVEQTIQPHDSISINEQEERRNYGEPMIRANHGASDQEACRKVWKHAQRLADKDGRPRIPPKTLISEAPDVESQAALRRGVAAEEYRNKRDQHRYKEWEKNRRVLRPASRTKSAYRWIKVPYSQKTTRTRPHKPQSIHLERRYDSLREYESDEFHYTPDSHTQVDGKIFHPRSSIHSSVEWRMNSGGGRVRRNRGRQSRELGVSDVPYPTQVHFIYFQGRSVRYELRMPASLPYLAIRDMVAMSRSFRGRQRPNSGSRGPEISGTRVRQRFPLGGSGIPSVSIGGPSHS